MLFLTKVRVDNGLSKAALARRASIDQSRISKIEAGREIPYPRELQRIAAALGVPDADGALLLTDCTAEH
jgi:transcriptional regulator with XRE-family HTH domain